MRFVVWSEYERCRCREDPAREWKPPGMQDGGWQGRSCGVAISCPSGTQTLPCPANPPILCGPGTTVTRQIAEWIGNSMHSPQPPHSNQQTRLARYRVPRNDYGSTNLHKRDRSTAAVHRCCHRRLLGRVVRRLQGGTQPLRNRETGSGTSGTRGKGAARVQQQGAQGGVWQRRHGAQRLRQQCIAGWLEG